MTRVLTRTLYYHYGDTFDDYQVIWKDGSGTPLNLTGYTATLRIKPQVGGSTALELNSSGNGLVITPAAGLIDFQASSTKMKSGSLAANTKYVYDLQVALGTSDIKTLIKGDFIVDAEITDV
jgi:hypothetical protein